MTQGPDHMTGSPVVPVDVLSEVLRGVRLTGALYYRVSTSTPWPAILVPPGRSLVSAFGGRTRNVASYHVVLEGTCWTGLRDGQYVRLQPGDVVVYPRGDRYVLSCDRSPARDADADDLVELLQAVASGAAPPSFTFGDTGERTSFVCGFLGCGPQLSDPVLSSLPPMLHLEAADDRLKRLVQLAPAEVDGSPGAASVRERLSESMFLETVRQYLATSSRLGWVATTGDEIVARSLVLLHEDIRRPWTLNSLAQSVGVSRSVLADRFGRSVGQPAMHYLAGVRLRLAGQLLVQETTTVSAIARQVGYASEPAFSRAFKRATGLAPAAWRAEAAAGPGHRGPGDLGRSPG